MKYILLGNWLINIEQIAYIKIEEYNDTATVVMSNGASYNTGTHVLYLIENAKPIEEIKKEI